MKGSFSLVTLPSLGILALAHFLASGQTRFPTLQTTKGIQKYRVEILRVNWNVNWSHFYTFMFLPLFILFKLLALASEKLCYWFNTKVNVAFWTYLRYLVVENIAKACSYLHGIVSSFSVMEILVYLSFRVYTSILLFQRTTQNRWQM